MKKTTLKISLVLVMLLAFVSTLMIFSNVKATETDDIILLDDATNEGTTSQEALEEVYNDDLYEVSDGDYTMDRLVDGNAFIISSGNVTVTGKINGALYVLAKEVTISKDAYIYDSAYIAASKVKLDAYVYDCYVATQEFEMGENAYVQRDLRAVTQDSNLLGTVYRNAFISSGTIKCSESNYGLLVYGNLEYTSKERIENEESIVPYGTITFQETKETEKVEDTIGDKVVDLIQKIIFAVSIYVLITFVTSKFNDKLGDYISSKSVKTFFIGLLGLIVVPIVAVLLMVTVIGLPLGCILLVLYVFAALLSTTVTEIAISNKIAGKIKLDKNIWTKMLSVAIVVVVVYVLKIIPVISGLVGIITVFLGFGIIASYVFGKVKENKNTEIAE